MKKILCGYQKDINELLDKKSKSEIEEGIKLLNIIQTHPEYMNFDGLNIEKVIFDTFMIIDDVSRSKTLLLFPDKKYIRKGELLFRVRKISDKDMIRCKENVLNPPVSCVNKRMRLNDIGESVLYASLDKDTAIEEAGGNSTGYYALIEIETTRIIETVKIGFPKNISILSQESYLKVKLISDFLLSLFTKKVDSDLDDRIYRLSNAIGKYCFCLGEDFEGWYYPSIVKADNRFNVCLKPDKIKDAIKIKSIKIYSYENPQDEPDIIDTSLKEWG